MSNNDMNFVDRRVREGTIADRRDAGTINKKRWSRILNITFVIFTSVALVAPGIMSAYLGVGIHVTMTGSMRPSINPGDVMLSKVEKVSDVKIGQVVLFLDNRTWQEEAHRVTSVVASTSGITITTKGDANPDPDPVQTYAALSPIRYVTSVVPKVGYVLNAFKSKIVILVGGILLLLINLLIVLNVMVKRRKTDPKPPSFRDSHDLHNRSNLHEI
jgi:signal peptidase I